MLLVKEDTYNVKMCFCNFEDEGMNKLYYDVFCMFKIKNF